MRKTITIVIISFLVLSFTLLISCNSCQNTATTKKPNIRTEKAQMDSLDKAIKKNVYPLPTSAQVIKMLSDLEVGYIIGLTNPVENANKYYTSASRSINMGVLGADLSYVTLYVIKQHVNDYMNAIRIIANELNMAKVYNAALYDSIKLNFDYKDRLVTILTNAFNDTYAYLVDNDQQNLALLVVGGAWVEGMYITTQVSAAAYQFAGISKVLLEQKKSFELYLELTKTYLNDPMVGDFVKKLEPIRKVYEGIGTSLTTQNINDITKAIVTIREQIIQF
jgi:hypothetical protein